MEDLCGEDFERENMSVLGDADACSEEVDTVVSEADDKCQDLVPSSNDFHDVAYSPVIGGTRQEWEQAIRCDNSLLKWKHYADTNQKGFYGDGLLLKKNYVDSLGNIRCVLVAPSQFRCKILDAGHRYFC